MRSATAAVKRADDLREARLETQEEQRLAAEEEALKEENCRRSRARLASYQIPNALILQQDGSRIRVDENTRQMELAKSNEILTSFATNLLSVVITP